MRILPVCSDLLYLLTNKGEHILIWTPINQNIYIFILTLEGGDGGGVGQKHVNTRRPKTLLVKPN